jgi:hypothetical protein
MAAAVNRFTVDLETFYQSIFPLTTPQAVTPSDTVDLTNVTRALWVGGAGNINLIFADGTTQLISGVPAGTLLPFRVSRVKSTTTTATLIVALD